MSNIILNLPLQLITYRPVTRSEETKVVKLWQTTFEPKSDGYFERYFSSKASPHYQEGDTLGAWLPDDRLVSVVHIRRMILRSASNETFLCGVVSNVATQIEFRNQGLSRQLLVQAIKKMEQEDFDLSILGTGRPHHYLPLVFEHWIGWHWQNDLAYIYLLPNKRGYAVISQPDGKNGDVYISEWRALDIDAEIRLLTTAASEIKRRYRRSSFLLHTLPQYASLKSLGWGSNDLIFEQNDDILMRNIRLGEELFKNIKSAFETNNGQATFWPQEYF